MIVICPECGSKCRIPDSPQTGRRYLCAKCKTTLIQAPKQAGAQKTRNDILRRFDAILDGKLQTRRYYLPFCFTCFFLALLIGLFTTQAGTGITEDSVGYIANGESLYNGTGFESTYNHYPLYPILIAGLMYLGLGAEQAARMIPIFSFALLVFPVFFLGRLSGNILVAYISSFMCVVLFPLLMLTAQAWNEMPYVFFSVMAILFLAMYAKNEEANIKLLGIGALFVAAALLTRFTGAVLIPVGLITVVAKNRTRPREAVLHLLLFVSISVLPLVPWLYRNYTVTSHLTMGFSLRDNGAMRALFSFIEWIVIKIIYDFNVLLILVIGLAAMAWRIDSRDRRKANPPNTSILGGYLRKNYVLILYIFGHLAMLIVTGIVWEVVRENRFIYVVYPIIVITLVSFILYFYKLYTHRTQQISSLKPMFTAITIVCALFLIFQISQSAVIYQTYKDGYGFNSPSWRSSKGIAWLESNLPDNAILYTNNISATQFLLQRQIASFPSANLESEKSRQEFLNTLENTENSFMISFKGDEWGKESGAASELSYSEITGIVQECNCLVVAADFPESTIWRHSSLQ